MSGEIANLLLIAILYSATALSTQKLAQSPPLQQAPGAQVTLGQPGSMDFATAAAAGANGAPPPPLNTVPTLENGKIDWQTLVWGGPTPTPWERELASRAEQHARMSVSDTKHDVDQLIKEQVKATMAAKEAEKKDKGENWMSSIFGGMFTQEKTVGGVDLSTPRGVDVASAVESAFQSKKAEGPPQERGQLPTLPDSLYMGAQYGDPEPETDKKYKNGQAKDLPYASNAEDSVEGFGSKPAWQAGTDSAQETESKNRKKAAKKSFDWNIPKFR